DPRAELPQAAAAGHEPARPGEGAERGRGSGADGHVPVRPPGARRDQGHGLARDRGARGHLHGPLRGRGRPGGQGARGDPGRRQGAGPVHRHDLPQASADVRERRRPGRPGPLPVLRGDRVGAGARRRLGPLAIAAASALMAGSCGGGQPSSTGVTSHGALALQKVGSFDSPVYVTAPPGDAKQLFVVEQTGRIRVVRDGTVLRRPFLDLSGRVSCCGEQGLLSMAFAPGYRRSGRFYVDYTDAGGDTRVVEYRRRAAGPLAADPSCARVVLTVEQPYPNHNGGQLQFGPDGYLYIGLGDGGSEGDPQRTGQDLSTMLGKILRIDPRPARGQPYRVPADNPFAGVGGARPEIYAYGLRNPWRFSFDRQTSSLWIGDVGQNELEEVDSIGIADGAGANFGWSAYEGDARFNRDQRAP